MTKEEEIVKMDKYDFSGWATRANIKCSDGRTIMKDAFKHNDGQKVPLVWNHQHNSPDEILGHAMLENRDEGVYAYCTFNDSEAGKTAKLLVQHGDIEALSIYANQLKEKMSNVIHGNIREVSLVLSGANIGAYIDNVIAHGEESSEEAYIFTGEDIVISHSDDEKEEEESDMKNEQQNKDNGEGKTLQDIFDTMTEEQQNAAFAVVGMAISDKEEEMKKKLGENNDVKHSEGGDNIMKHNVFDQDDRQVNTLTHSDQQDILKMAKSSQVGSFQTALEIFADENELKHADALAGGFIQTTSGNVTELFPEYRDVRPGAPELVTNDQGWISVVMSKVHKSPISRIRTSHVDIRNIDALRGKGYTKGIQKALAGNFKLVRRTTDPQTIYVRNALHRDDIVDITDFDYVKYLYDIDKMMLNEEIATAIMLGDGRDDVDEGKISPDHIRPIWLDDDLYTLHVDIDLEAARKELQGTNTSSFFGDNYITAEAMINTVLYAREKFKGTGTPDFFMTPHMLNVMLLARDINGRRIYSSKAELASALNVGSIFTAEQFAGKTRTTADLKTKQLHGIIANLSDYSLGATKGGEVTHFTQFDIDFNQEKSLLETRCSGALTRVYSAIAIEEDITAPIGG